MANKVRVTALFLVLAILIATFGAVSVIHIPRDKSHLS